MVAVEEPEAFYIASDGISKVPCTLRQAQLWLFEGYFTSSTRFALRGRDGREEWRTVGEWIERNGRAMPFTEWISSEEQKKEKEEELGRLRQELAKVNQRREGLLRLLVESSERRTIVQKELDRIAQKFPDAMRSMKPHALLGAELSVEAEVTTNPASVIYPQISPQPGVDPFALLKSCSRASRKMKGDVESRLKLLLALFDRCDKKRLVQQTSQLFPDNREWRMCSLCKVRLNSANVVVMHVCSDKHLMAMGGAACADAFEFWFEAVTATLREEYKPGYKAEVKPAPATVLECSPTPVNDPSAGLAECERKPPTPTLVVYPQISPPPGVDPFALLKSCAGARRKLEGDVGGRFRQLRTRFDRCDKKRLVQQTSVLFAAHNVTKCTLCQLKIVSSNNVVEHCCGRGHLTAMGDAVCADAFDFWWKAVEMVELSELEPACEARPEPAIGVRSKPPAEEWPKLGREVRRQQVRGAWSKPSYGVQPTSGLEFPGLGAEPEPGARVWPEPAFRARTESATSSEPSKSTSAQPIAPPDRPELAVLRRTPMGKNAAPPLRFQLQKILAKFNKCDKKKLDSDPITLGLFEKPLVCLICDRCAIDRASNLVSHITGAAHWEAIVEARCSLPRHAIDFWTMVVQRASNN